MPLVVTRQQKSIYGQPDGQRWASFTSSDKTGEPSVPTKTTVDASCVSRSLCFRFYFQKSQKIEKKTNRVHEKENK